MAFLLKKVIKPWNSGKTSNSLTVPDQPMCPPSPDLSHLTPEEISAIHDVIRRQEEFDRQEADRVRRLKNELDSLQQQLAIKSIASTQKVVDLRLCRLCFKTKFADGVGRVCSDCQQRVCPKCGAFCKPRSSGKKNKVMTGRWRCKLCIARREMLCRTGKWYHGTPDHSEGLKKKLSQVYDQDTETDAGSSTYQANVDDSEAGPSGNRTDSELFRRVLGKPASKHATSCKKYSRRRSLPPDSGARDEKSDNPEDDDDYRDSLDSLILERRLSRRRRQEKKQRRKLRAGADQRSTDSLHDDERAASSDRLSTARKSGERRDSVTRSLWGHSNSLTSCARKQSRLKDDGKDNSGGSSTSVSSVFSSFRDSSMSDGFNGLSPVVSPPSLKITRQDALSLNSSCVSITSASEPGRRSYAGSSDPVSTRSWDSSYHSPQHHKPKLTGAKVEERMSPKLLGEKSEEKWKQAGFTEVYLVSLQRTQNKEHPYGLKVVGGHLDELKTSRALATWVSADVRSKISVGHEILEWNGETLRGQTYDYVITVMTFVYPQVIVIASPRQDRLGNLTLYETPIVITQDGPANNSPELSGRGGKRRMLPRTPVEIKRGTRQIKGEVKIRLIYQPYLATLAVSILRARNIISPSNSQNISPSCFVVISIVPGKRENYEIELQTSDSHPEWEQIFLFSGVTLTELVSKAIQITVWCSEEKCDQFVGEVLLDLVQAHLDNQAQWYNLEEHDENSGPLPHRRNSRSASLSASLTSGSFKDSSLFSPAVSPEVPSQRQHQHSPSSIGSNNVSPVPSGISNVGSREFHLNSVSQPDSFTTKVRKKMRTTVSKMASLTINEKKDNAGSDDSSQSDIIRRSSDKSDKSIPLSRSPKAMKRRQNSSNAPDHYKMEAYSSLSVSSDHSMDLLAPPVPPSRTNSSSSFFLSEDEDTHGSIYSAAPDRPALDNVNSTLGPGQIPPKSDAENLVCGDIKLGFMVSKGQLEVDIICAVGLNKSGPTPPPDTYVKTYLVEGKKVLQRKKTFVIKASFDPVYRKKVKYSACNVHGRIMKVVIWERISSFEKKNCRGEVLVQLDCLDLSKHTVAWYRLFQMNSTDYGSDEYLSMW